MFARLCLHLQMQGVHLLHFQHGGLSLVDLILQTLTVFQRYSQSFQAVIVTAVTEHVPKLIYCPHNLTWNQRAKLEIILGGKNRVSDG